MTIQTVYVPLAYFGDGVTSVFPVTWPYQFATDIVVQQENTATNVITTLVLGTDFTVAPTTNSPAGTGSVTLIAGALASGLTILISRAVPNTQLTHWIPNDPNPSIAIENAVDKLTMEFQQNTYGLGRTWYLRPFDTDGSGMFDARGNRGGNAGDPVLSQDFVTLAYMTNYVTQLIQTGFSTTPPDYQYVGDGTTAVFALPGATVPQNSGYFVTEDGLLQRPTADYSITLGAAPFITFAAAPPLNVKVAVRVLGFLRPITGGIDGGLINSGRVLPQFLGTGTPTQAKFLRGDGTWANTLIGPLGPCTIGTSQIILADFQSHSDAAIRVTCANGNRAALFFGVSGAATVENAAIEYDSSIDAICTFGAGPPPRTFFYGNGNVTFGSTLYHIASTTRVGINQASPQYDLDVFGTVNATHYVGNADGSLITSGQVLPQYLASNTPSNALFLRGDGIWAIPPGGGGGGGPTTIQISDLAIASSTVGTINFHGQTANASGIEVPIYIQNLSAQTAAVRAYIPGTGANKPGVITSTAPTNTSWTVSSTVGGVLMDTDGLSQPSFGLITPANMAATGTLDADHFLSGADTWIKIAPTGLSATNSVADTLIPSYDLASGKFKWVSNSTTPAGGNAGQFLRGDNTWSNTLHPLSGSGVFAITDAAGSRALYMFGTSVSPPTGFNWVSKIGTASGSGPPWTTWDTTGVLYFESPVAIDNGSAVYATIDPTVVEFLQIPGGIGRALSWRAQSGSWELSTLHNAPASSLTLDLATSSYHRLTGFANSVSITLADTTSAPTSLVYATAMTIELNSLGSFDITWPGTITWAGAASAPTVANGGLSSSGINVVKLIRRQGQTQWVGYLDNVSSAGGGSYTDNQARQALLNATALPNSSTIGWTFSGSPANQVGTVAVVAGSIGNTQLASGIAASKLSGYPTDATKFLRGDGAWAVPPGTGGGGQASIQFQNQGSNIGSAGAITTLNFAGAGVSSAVVGTTATVTIAGGIAGLAATNNSVAVSGGPFTTINAPAASNITLSSPSAGILNIVASGGGTFSPATSYTWTAGQAYQAANTHTATEFYSTNLPGPFSGTATVGIGGLSDGSLGGTAGMYVHVLNNSSTANAPSTQTATFWQTMNNPGAGINAIESVLDIRGNCNINGFQLGFTQQTSVRQLNMAGTTDAVWLVSSSPNAFYASSTDGNGIKHSFGSGHVRIGEFNYGNAWADFGLQETIFGSQIVSGIDLIPDYIAGPVGGLSSNYHHYDAQWAVGIQYAGADAFGHAPQNHIGLFVVPNAISPGGYAVRLRGASGTFNGNSAATNAPAALIKMSDTASTGIDFAGTAGDATPLTATATGAPVITMADDQSIKLGSIWIRGHSGALQYSTNGTSWSNVTLP